jgi:hypothetical protein
LQLKSDFLQLRVDLVAVLNNIYDPALLRDMEHRKLQHERLRALQVEFDRIREHATEYSKFSSQLGANNDDSADLEDCQISLQKDLDEACHALEVRRLLWSSMEQMEDLISSWMDSHLRVIDP